MSAFPDPPTDPASLTPRQRKVLDVIRDWVERFGYPPSVREIGDAVGLTSTSSVHHQLRTLERKGYLRRDPHRTRAVDVRGPDDPAGNEVDEAGGAAADVGNEALRFPTGLRRFSGHVILQQLRFPLEDFDALDLADIRAIEIRFDRTNKGVIDVADLAFSAGDGA